MSALKVPESWTYTGGLKIARAEPDWIIKGLIERGDQWIVSGQAKAGKSLFAMSLGVSIATGENFIGYECIEPRKVLYIDLELKDRVFWNRIDLMLTDKEVTNGFPNLIRPDNLKTLDVFNEQDQTLISETIKKAEPELIIWDVLSRLHNRDENDNGSMKQLLQKIRVISRDLAHVIVHHSRKNVLYGNSDAQSIRGAGAIHGEVDGAITLTSKSKLGICNMNISARAIPPQDDRLLEIDKNLCFRQHIETKAEEIDQSIRKCLGADARLTSNALNMQIRTILEIEERQASRIIAQAKKLKLIVGIKSGRSILYSLTDQSKADI